MPTRKQTGVVRRYSKVKGYGFISTPDDDVFLHASQITCDAGFV